MTPYSTTTASKDHGSYDHITTHDTVRDIVNHPAFKGFSQLILPKDNNAYYYDTPLSNVRALMPYHSHVDPDIVVAALNHMIDEVKDGKTIFYDFYTEQQKQEDPAKEEHRTLLLPGRTGSPVCHCVPWRRIFLRRLPA